MSITSEIKREKRKKSWMLRAEGGVKGQLHRVYREETDKEGTARA